jgi:predicted N-acetyltransferase YhbS
MTIRRAVRSDAPSLTSLMRSSAAYVGEFATMINGYTVSTDQIANDELFVAEDDGQLLGFYSVLTTPIFELDLMFVADSAQGQKIGHRLFQHMCERAKALGAAQVRIVSHPPSAGFYERMGAQVVGCCLASGNVNWDRPILEMPL